MNKFDSKINEKKRKKKNYSGDICPNGPPPDETHGGVEIV